VDGRAQINGKHTARPMSIATGLSKFSTQHEKGPDTDRGLSGADWRVV
jgi:hypothetical protein